MLSVRYEHLRKKVIGNVYIVLVKLNKMYTNSTSEI